MDGLMRFPVRPGVAPRLGGPPPVTPVSSGTGYPWVDGDILYAADLNAAFIPMSGGHPTGYLTAIADGQQSVATQENYPTLDFMGGAITFQRKITNATGDVAAVPNTRMYLSNSCSNFVIQSYGSYDGPTSLYVEANAQPGSNGSTVSQMTRLISQGNNPFTSQDVAGYFLVNKRGQNSTWAICIQHEDDTGLPPQPFAQVGIECGIRALGADTAASMYDPLGASRFGITVGPTVLPTTIAWSANTLLSVGVIVVATPSGGQPTCYISQNTGTTGATHPTWPTSGTVVDGTITWLTGVVQAVTMGTAIYIGPGARPQPTNVTINTGIGVDSQIGNACIDLTEATLVGANAAGIRLRDGMPIDFTGGGSNSNKNLRTLAYSDFLNGVVMNTPAGTVSVWGDNGQFIASGQVLLAGSSNLSGITTGYNTSHLTIGKNHAGLGEIDFIVGAADFINFYGTDGSGVLAAPWLTLSTTGISLAANQVVGPRITGWGTSTGGARAAIAAGSATLPQVAAAVAQLLTDLKTHGLLGT